MKFIQYKLPMDNREYIYYECKLNLRNDLFIQEIIEASKQEASRYNGKQANKSDKRRSLRTLNSDVFVGLLTEYIWEYFLNKLIKVEGSSFVSRTNYNPKEEQIDLIIYNNHTIEVRSSNVRNGIPFGINNFDILGPYTNMYKPKEEFKSFYLRTLYTLTTEKILFDLQNGRPVSIYLMGGATRSMMEDDKVIVYKDLKPNNDKEGYKSRYRCIPIKNGLDAKEIVLELRILKRQ